MNPILVTCAYFGRSCTVIGGKDVEEEQYISSLRNLANLKLPVHLYCWPNKVDLLTELTKPYFDKIKIIGCDLMDYPRSKEILKTKEKFVNIKNGAGEDITYSPRNELLCHWKLKWCSNARNNEWGCDKVFWIDAGVTEWSKIPKSMGGAEYVYKRKFLEEYKDDHYWPINQNNIFNEKISDGIKRIFAKNEWFFIYQNSPNDKLSTYDWDINDKKVSKILNKTMGWQFPKQFKTGNFSMQYPLWTVGTFFGGSFDFLDKKIIPLYDKLFNIFTDDDDILPFTEEPYYSIIAYEYNLNLFWFDSWNHCLPDEPCFHNSVLEKPFYTTLLDTIKYE